jgi:hypothetical protein
LPLEFEHVTVILGGFAQVARSFELDWVLVRVNTVRRIGIAVVIVVAAAALGLLVYRHLNPPLDVQAKRALELAEQYRERVLAITIPETWRENVAAAEVEIEAARTAYTTTQWVQTITYAESATSRYSNMLGVSRSQLGGVGHFRSLDGRIQVQRAGKAEWQSAHQRMAVFNGDYVRTARDGSAEILFDDGSLYRIGPNSLLEIHHQSETPLESGTVKMVVGRINVYTSENPSTVTTEAAKTEIDRDSRVALNVDEEDRKTTVAAFKGRARVSNPRGMVTVQNREQVAAATDGTFSPKQLIPDPPLQVEPHNNAGFDITQDSIIHLEWRRPRPTNAVHLQVSRSHRFIEDQLDVDASELGKDSARLKAIATGTYFWRLATVSGDDLRSEWSPVRRFRIYSPNQQTLMQDKTPPALEVYPPQQLGTMFIIEGRTEVGATVTINDEIVSLDSDGRFRKTVEVINNGWNDLVIAAVDPSGNRTERRERVHVEVF